MSDITIRGQIKEIQVEISHSEDLLPDRAAELLAKLAALLGNCLDEIRKRDAIYRQILLLAYESEKHASRAKIKAENDPSYQDLREAQDTKILTLEMLRSLKYFLKEKQEEFMYGNHQ